ncbi:type II toxin-antitoxin system PemK/MazF family toxin [Tessaracoccus rhinocerotis]|uniref:Type II toxin-antitoxin system PemK/MazF family toxin n=1 Tax=Tessaracoccus rhinocerotis TaxID=1689449 RepID=A0A553K0T7_9ACTN|nr:type II toxin-antitoxin system PemK/MazF family toxin [Tessaracoccus rhinocerotis]TRY18320.1 type II toxin-antitoxin system PemK/MazF family toxin [Tessaracoccus rhinocerotis]
MARNQLINAGLRLVQDMVSRALKQQQRKGRRRDDDRRDERREDRRQQASDAYPGDFTGRPEIVYAPRRDAEADPGEVVWTWVPYEEDPSQGKDRPALVIGRDGQWLLVLQVTSQDHDRDAAQEASVGRYWTDIGTGEWDNHGRPSEVRVNRIIRIDPDKVRRIGAILDEGTFNHVRQEVLKHY